MKDDIQLFILWPKALKTKERVLADIRGKAEILAVIELDWPEGVDAETGYRLFYGRALPSAKQKCRTAGVGPFTVVIVRIAEPHYKWIVSQKGLANVCAEVFDMKWRYRGWAGGMHSVHGTLSAAEAYHDIVTITGHTPEEWALGKVSPADAKPLAVMDAPPAIAHIEPGTPRSVEAAIMLGLDSARPVPGEADLFRGELEGAKLRIRLYPTPPALSANDWKAVKRLRKIAPEFAAEIPRWFIALGGMFVARRDGGRVPIARRVAEGPALSAAALDRAAADAVRLAGALDGAKVVHRTISAENLLIGEDGSLELEDFRFAVMRDEYRTETQYFRKDVAARLIPLGAAGSPAPGAWNDRLAIAKALSALPRNARLDEAIARLESEAAGGKGTLWVRVRKLSCRLAAAYFRSLFSRSPSAARTRAFAVNAFTHIGS